MDNIIKFPKEPIQRLTTDKIPVNQVLLGADKANLDAVVVIGMKDGKVQVFGSDSDIGNAVFLMEAGKAIIISDFIDSQQE